MKIWLDAHLPPSIVSWISDAFQIDVVAVRDIGFRDSSDEEIFLAARAADTVVMTKDRDFLRLIEQRGAPPKIIWITCGNTSNTNLRRIQSLDLL